MSREFIIYADESEQKGFKFSNFYGGALVSSTDVAQVNASIRATFEEQNLHKEVKWSKVTANYLEKYVTLMDCFFGHVAEGRVKVRIMFTDNRFSPSSLTSYHREHEYFLLYYQFLKHAFGLQYANPEGVHTRCRLYLDQLPDTREKAAQFKGYLHGLTCVFRNGVFFDEEQIAEVRSHDHGILQCLDIVLGSMHFRLNGKHRLKPEGQRVRGKRTIAKEKLYKAIYSYIRELRPNFNIGITTADGAGPGRWEHPYRHWNFKPKEWRYQARP
ncbi:MAG: DUF3800 domain-containing protein [Planctomycetota bacterium]|jgi:hypothetical protein